MLSTALAFATWSEHRPSETLNRPLEQVPTQLGKWKMVDAQQLMPSVARVLNASSYVSRTYTDGRTELSLFIAYYAFQRAGETMHSPKHCLPGAGWDISAYGTDSLATPVGTATVNRFVIQKGSEHEQALYWYQSKGRVIANEYRAKALLIWDGVTKGRTSGSIVRIISADQPEATTKAHEFASLVMPEVQQCFGR
jgi:EpsI family protein